MAAKAQATLEYKMPSKHENPLQSAWVEARATGDFTEREEQFIDFLLDRRAGTIDELFEIATKFGMYGDANLRANVQEGRVSSAHAQELKRQALAKYCSPRLRQQYLGSLLNRLNAKLRKHGVPAQVKPGPMKQTYIITG